MSFRTTLTPRGEESQVRTDKGGEQMKSKQYFVYMMSNAGKTVLYTGVTSNLFKRVYEHKHNLKGKFTQLYNCNILVYFEETNLSDAAINREKQIKGLSRTKKDALVNEKNPKWKDLSDGWYS